MFVEINGKSSQERIVNFGVPQGSILGPYLFLIFINDIAECDLKGDLILYADDTNIFYTANTKEELIFNMQKDLITLQSWFQQNKLVINIEKCNFMVFSKNSIKENMNQHLYFNNQNLFQVFETKFLGLWILHNLDWSTHLNKLYSKISCFIGVFYRTKHLIPYSCKHMLYYSLVHSHLSHLIVIWGYSSSYKLQPLKTVQNRIIKTLFNLPHRTHTTNVYTHTKIFPLSLQLKLNSAMLIHKLINKKIHTTTDIKLNKDVHNYNTRNNNKPYILQRNTSSFGINSCLSRSIQFYNSLEENITNSSTKSFKSKLLVRLRQSCEDL